MDMISALREFGRGLVKEFRDNGGFLTAHLREVMKLPPEILSIEAISLVGRVGTTTLTNPATYPIPSNMLFEITGMMGCIESPDDGTTENNTRLEFQLSNTGKAKRDMFGQPINMGFLLGTPFVPGRLITFPRGLYVCPASSNLQLAWSRRTTAGAWVGADKDVGVLLIGNNIVKSGSMGS